MRDLNYDLKNLCRRNRDGSYSTQANRHQRLQQMANDLHALGFRQLRARSLKPKHVEALLALWRCNQLNVGTIKNRLTDLRWWAEKVDKKSVIRPTNADYGIARRQYLPQQSKAIPLQAKILQQLQDPYVRLAVRLQAAFGLRREEAIKLMPHLADRGQELYLKPSWCKGGRERTLPIRNQHQRQVLDEAHELAGRGSLIPSHLRYVEQLRIFERATSRAGLGNTHGLRHHYAQERYAELTGWECPLNEGPNPQTFSPEQQEVDREARKIVSQELGHERIQITNIYLGK